MKEKYLINESLLSIFILPKNARSVELQKSLNFLLSTIFWQQGQYLQVNPNFVYLSIPTAFALFLIYFNNCNYNKKI